jgi:hypothetical protein
MSHPTFCRTLMGVALAASLVGTVVGCDRKPPQPGEPVVDKVGPLAPAASSASR